MLGDQRTGKRQRERATARLDRDAALVRVGRTRRWVVAASAALTAAVAAWASSAAPGRSLGTSARFAGTSAARASTPKKAASEVMPALASPLDLGLQAPGDSAVSPGQTQVAPQAPSDQSAASVPIPDPSQGGGPVVSGGS